MEVHYKGQDHLILTPGTYACVPPELSFTAECVSIEPCLMFIIFELPIDAFVAEE
jgi:hypothetical protein